MKPRLFTTILLAFVLVIVLGLVGMITFFAVAIRGVWQPDSGQSSWQAEQEALAASLADYYIAHANSWEGVEQRLSHVSFSNFPGPSNWLELVVLDHRGEVVASTTPAVTPGSRLDSGQQRADALPIVAGSQRVGTLLIQSPDRAWDAQQKRWRGPPAFIRPILRGFLLAALGLATLLLLLAVVLAQRLSQPIRRLTSAAQMLAHGQLDVQVRGAPVWELDELASAFNRMSQALARADYQRRQMTADIAHELRTPLAILKGRLEGLQDGVYELTPDQLERLLEETLLLERLIEDLRLLALAEAGQLPLYREATSPRELLEGASMTFAEEAAARGIALQLSIADPLPPVDVDPQRMAQLLANLISNALHHTPAGGMITLRAYQSAGRDLPPSLSPLSGGPSLVVLEVEDTGEGIAPDHLPHLFDRFWRADRSRTRESGGTGLGLAIARQIVTAHGGTIGADSVPQRGTTIRIALVPAGESSSR